MSIDIANILDTVQAFVDETRIVASQDVVRRFHSADEGRRCFHEWCCRIGCRIIKNTISGSDRL